MPAIKRLAIGSAIGSVVVLLAWLPLYLFQNPSPSTDTPAVREIFSLWEFAITGALIGGSAGLLYRHKKSFYSVLIMSLLYLGSSMYILANPPMQCVNPGAENLSPPDCIIGSDIGSGVFIFTFGFCLVIVVSVLFLDAFISNIRHRRKKI